MISFTNKILNDTVFKILIVVITFFMQIHFIHLMYGGYVKYILAFGLLVCGWQLFNKTLLGKLNDKVSILLLAFSTSYALTILINREISFSHNINQLVYMVVFFLLLAMVDCEKPSKRIKQEIRMLSWIIIVFSFVLAILTLSLYVLNISEWYMIEGKNEYFFIGDGWFDFWGFCNPNTGGTIAVIAVWSSIFLIAYYIKKEKTFMVWLSLIFLFFHVLCEYAVILLLESRGAYYGLLFSGFVFVFMLLYAVLKFVKKSSRMFMAILLSVILCFSFICVSSVLKEGMNSFVIVSEEDANDITKDTRFENEIEKALKDIIIAGTPKTGKIGFLYPTIMDVNENIDIDGINNTDQAVDFTTGRVDIWKAGILSFRTAPLFGLTREGMVDIVCDQFAEDADTSAIVGGGLHNMYLTVLCASGIVGFVILAAAVCIVLYRFFKCLVKSPQIDMCMLFAFVICLFFFVTELVENRILYQVNFFNVVFWIYFGYLNKLSLLKLEELSEK